jgi:hypothetical protein
MLHASGDEVRPENTGLCGSNIRMKCGFLSGVMPRIGVWRCESDRDIPFDQAQREKM